VRIRYLVLPAMLLSSAAFAQVQPQQAPQDQAFSAMVTSLSSIETSVASLKFAIVQYQNAMLGKMQQLAGEVAALQKQATDTAAYWKAYTAKTAARPAAPVPTPKPAPPVSTPPH
jgi:hypothetical protein